MNSHLGRVATVADNAWCAALHQRLTACLPASILHIDTDVSTDPITPRESPCLIPHDLILCAIESPGQVQTRDQGQDLLGVVRLLEPSCTVTVRYPIAESSDRGVSLGLSLLSAVVTLAVDSVQQATRYTAAIVRQHQLQRALDAVEQQLQASERETTDAWAQLQQHDREYVAQLEQAVAHQTAQLHEISVRLEAASAVKSQFLTLMSHELRTPLNGVLGMTSLLLETPLNQEQQEYAELARGAGQVLLSRINDLLDFAQLGTTPRALECIDFNLRTLVEEVLDAFSTPAQQKGLNLIGHIHPEVPTWVVGAPRQLRRVLSSLVDNAVKFTEVGEVVVEIACPEAGAEDTCVQIEVRDTGMGIAPDVKSKLFTPFAQGDSSSTRAHGGTGLGLAIASQLMSRMNGTLEVSSTSGQGSTFRVTLPITKRPI